MRVLIKFLTLFVLTFCYANAIHASEQDNCVYFAEKISNTHRIDQMITTDEGVFLLVDDQWIGAEGVLAMPDSVLLLEDGKWVSIGEVMNCDTYKTWKCRVCGYINPQGVTRCLNYKNHPK